MIRLCALVLASCVVLSAQSPAAAKATFVGTETCQTCHEDVAKAFARNPHRALETSEKRGWTGRSCEACHGAGSNHAESTAAAEIRNPQRLTASETDRLCLTCHVNQNTQVGRIMSSHARDQVSCTTCHKVHANGPAGLVARKPAAVNELCAGCHLTAWSQFQKPYTHRLAQNAMSCVDCHNPHGAFRPGMVQLTAGNEPGCFRCHAEVRGPFTYEHAPVRFEGCGTCHETHGSANPRMLVRQEVRQLCLECHSNLPNRGAAAGNAANAVGVVPPAFHDLRSPRYRNCSVCHQKVHGSYVDRNLLR